MKQVFSYFSIILLILSFEVSASKCVAHRGFSKAALENSWAALIKAEAVNSDAIEFDLQHTKDRVAIVMHDKTLKRTATSSPGRSCPLEAKIKTLNYHQIKENCILKNGGNIPLFEDVLNYFSDRKPMLFIEFKDYPHPETFSLIEQYYSHAPQKLRVISFEMDYVNLVRCKTSSFWNSVKTMKLRKAIPALLSKKHGVNFYKGVPKILWPSPRKREVGLWTVDKQKKMKAAMKKGIHFITTNRPDLCLKIKKGFGL